MTVYKKPLVFNSKVSTLESVLYGFIYQGHFISITLRLSTHFSVRAACTSMHTLRTIPSQSPSCLHSFALSWRSLFGKVPRQSAHPLMPHRLASIIPSHSSHHLPTHTRRAAWFKTTRDGQREAKLSVNCHRVAYSPISTTHLRALASSNIPSMCTTWTRSHRRTRPCARRS